MFSSVAIGVLIVVILILFIVLIVIRVTRAPSNASVSTVNGQFLSSCASVSCSSPYVCDGSTYLCKLGTGSTCTATNQCIAGTFCSGQCVNGQTGLPNAYCPCLPGFSCTPTSTGLSLCKGNAGTPCSQNSECSSGVCQNNRCTSGQRNAFPCRSNSDCASNNCSFNFCQDPGFVSGTFGSACAGTCVGYTGAVCQGSLQQPLQCACQNGIDNPGTCVTSTRGVFASCSVAADCSDQLVCFAANGSVCGSGVSGCICLFPYQDPNDPPFGKSCLTGMIDRNGQCFNRAGLACDTQVACGQGSCQGPSVLAVYEFDIARPGQTGTIFFNSLVTAVTGAFSGPSGTIQPKKLFSLSENSFDTIYLVDDQQGLLFAQFNTNPYTVVAPWSIIIQHSVTSGNITRVLVDATYNGQFFLVAYQETRTSGSTTTQFFTVYQGTTLGNLVPFNVTSGAGFPGTQYSGTTPLNIDFIDLSLDNDVLITSSGSLYVKQSTGTNYSLATITGGPLNGQPATGVTGPGRFYFDNIQNSQGTPPPVCPGVAGRQISCPSWRNFALIKDFPLTTGRTVAQALQFSGNVAGLSLPIDPFGKLDYRVFDYSIFSPLTPVQPGGATGMNGSSIIALAQVYQGGQSLNETVVALSNSGSTTIFPYRLSAASRSVVTQNRFYVLSPASCG